MRRVLPGPFGEEAGKLRAPAHAVGAGFLPVAVAGHHRDGKPHQRPHVARDAPVGPQDLDALPRGGERGRHLPHARVPGAQPGVDLLQQLRLGLEAGLHNGVGLAVARTVGARGRVGQRAGMAVRHRRDGRRRAPERGLRELARMGVARRLAGHRAQAEAAVGVEARRLQPAVVEDQRLALAVLDIELAVVGMAERVGDDAAHRLLGNVEPVEKPGAHGRGRASKPAEKPARSTGMPMPSSGVWKTMKVAAVPLRSVSSSGFSRITSA